MKISVGFIGVGVIASAMSQGLAAALGDKVALNLSPRGADNAAALAAALPQARVMESNQAVVDQSDIVCLTVLPAMGERVVTPLRFASQQRVVSLMAGTPLASVARWVGQEVLSLHRMVALPFCARGTGPVAVYPGDSALEPVFSGLGELVAAPDEAGLDIFSAITALVSPFYRLVGQTARWGEAAGLPPDISARYTTALFGAMASRASLAGHAALGQLWEEMTPGGINALACDVIAGQGGFEAWQAGLTAALARNRGQKPDQ